MSREWVYVFQLAYQIDHIVTTSRTRSPCWRVPIASCSQARASLFYAWLINSNNSSPCRTHTHLAISHSNKESLYKFYPPHMEQLLFYAMFLCWRTSLVGIDCFASLHRKTQTLDGTVTFQRSIHSFRSALTSDRPIFCSIQLILLFSDVSQHPVRRSNREHPRFLIVPCPKVMLSLGGQRYTNYLFPVHQYEMCLQSMHIPYLQYWVNHSQNARPLLRRVGSKCLVGPIGLEQPIIPTRRGASSRLH